MPTQACLDNIKKKRSPVYCDTIAPGLCGRIQTDINEYCKHDGLGGNVPVPQSPEAGNCWCCCSCFGYGTPIEVAEKLYRMIEDIDKGQTVLTTDATVSGWVGREVTEIGGIAPESQVDFMAYAQFRMADGEVRSIITTADHLFLLPDGTLRPIQDLRPGDVVRQADGGEATIALTTWMQFSGGVRHIALGEWRKGDPLTGHLINANGLVTADLAVQLEHYSGGLTDYLAPAGPEGERPPIGSLEFHRAYDTTAYNAFMSDPDAWPKNAHPISPTLLNIPPGAQSYLTPAQAGDIQKGTGPQNLGDSDSMALTRYLFQLQAAWYPDIYFIVDWANELPNAWYFMDYKRAYVVLTGGLVRLDQLRQEGLAIILSHLVARSRGQSCTAEADYKGVMLYLRQVWFGDQFFSTYHAGLEQVEAMFGLISPENRKADPKNICRQPSIDCREQTLRAAAAMGKLPDCAIQVPEFRVVSAFGATDPSLDRSFAGVTFSQPVNPVTATNPENYVIPRAVVSAAKVDGADVMLTVDHLSIGAEYTITVQGVTSDGGASLEPGYDGAKFKTRDIG